MQTTPHKVCPLCGQRAVPTMVRCGRCGSPFLGHLHTVVRRTPPKPRRDVALPIGAGLLLIGLVAFFLLRQDGLERKRVGALVYVGPNIAHQVSVLEARVEPTTNAQGQETQKVVMRVRNNGPRPIREMVGDLALYDRDGRETSDSHTQSVLYTTGDDPPLQPGDTVVCVVESVLVGPLLGEWAVKASITVREAFERENEYL